MDGEKWSILIRAIFVDEATNQKENTVDTEKIIVEMDMV